MPIYTGDIIDYHSPYNSHLKLKAFCFLGEKPFAWSVDMAVSIRCIPN